MEKRIKAVTGGTTVIVITSLVILLIALITVLIAYSADKGLKGLIMPIMVDAGLIGLCIYSYLSVTTGYVIDNGNIRICRRKGDMIITGSNLTSVTPVSRNSLGNTIRVGANGGLFGFFGNVYSANLGKI
ncbi:MAG TPA: hypothetical protein VM802_24955, partial [Chitinophaga sp.]|uniref:hypothetical protein n=1 Tax=Chitinophaga sp. TaxID=1869181 RepID=UPI002C627546